MASAKLTFDKRRDSANQTYPFVIQLSHKHKTRFINLKLKLRLDQWEEKEGIIVNHPSAKRETIRVKKKLSDIEYFLQYNESRVNLMDINTLKSVILKEVLKEGPDESATSETPQLRSAMLGKYSEILIERLKKTNDPSKIKTAIWYSDSVSSIIKYNNDNDIQMIDIDVTYLEDYKAHFISTLKETKEGGKKKKSLNTLNCYLRGVRAIMNKARKEKMANGALYLDKSHIPFEDVKIPSQKTGKQGMTKDDINKIRDARIELGTSLWHNKNYFLFMFNLKGMNWVDLAHLKCYQINGEILTYYRSKTRKIKEFKIKLTSEAKELLGYYLIDKKPDDYVFPILSKELESDAEKLVKIRDQALHVFNEQMKELAEKLELTVKPTSYVVRHSWSKIAKKLGASTDKIKDSLGHGDYRTTEIYLDDIEDEILDDVNELVTAR